VWLPDLAKFFDKKVPSRCYQLFDYVIDGNKLYTNDGTNPFGVGNPWYRTNTVPFYLVQEVSC